MNPARSRMEASNGLERRMGAAVGMCILLQEVQMYATEDDDGQAVCSISSVLQMIVCCRDLTFSAQEKGPQRWKTVGK